LRNLLCTLLAAIAFTLTASSAFAADTATGDAPKATSTLEKMVEGVVMQFPRAEGPVTTSGDKAVRIGIGARRGIKVGNTIYFTRKGGPILHPVTKVVLGSKDIELGVGVVTEVTEQDALVEITELYATQVAEGDIARLPTTRARLLVAVVGKEYNELALDGVLDELRKSNRFSITGPSEVNPARLADDGFMKGLASDADTGHILLVSTEPTMGQGMTEARIRLMSADGSILYDATDTVAVTYEVFDERLMGVPLVRGERRDFFRMDDLPYRGVHMASGDVTGDDLQEIVVTDGKDVRVYRYTDGILRLLWTNQGSNGDSHLNIDVADMNGNGFDEIYVTNFQRGRMASFVIEYDGEKYIKTFGPSQLLFRVLEMPDGKKRLLTTTMGANSPYSGIINEYAWKDGELTKTGPAGLPDAIRDPYGFVIADIVPEKDKLVQEEGGAAAEPEIVFIDDYDYLQILDIDGGERIWKSAERFGGYDNFFETDKAGNILPNTDPRGKVKGSLIVREGPDGKPIVILTKNIPMTYVTQRFRGYSGAEMHALGWEGGRMGEVWSIRPIDGYLSDIVVGQVLDERRTDILILTEPTFKLKKSGGTLPIHSVSSVSDLFEDSSTLMFYKIPLR
jgi:hypothetical protein